VVEAGLFARDNALFQPGFAGCFQQGEGADDVSLDELRGTKDGAIHVRFGGKVHHGVNPIAAEEVIHQGAVTDIALYKGVTGWVGQILQVFQTARVGQQVQIDDVDGGVMREQIAHEVGTDKPGSAGNQ